MNTTPTPGDWGPWRLNPRVATLELRHDTGALRYEIDLERCLTTGQMLDWLMQIAGKRYATADMVAGLVHAFDDVVRPQRRMCSFGASGSVTRPQMLRLVADAAERWPHLCAGEAVE